MLDLSTSLDTVNDNILLSVVSCRFKVTDRAFVHFHSYLDGRFQCFTYRGQQTSGYEIDCRVPQGSTLEPVEFIAHTCGRHCKLNRQTSCPVALLRRRYETIQQLPTPGHLQHMRNRLSACVSWCISLVHLSLPTAQS
jgi:hypothetical protein